jgi:hypothetical protein
LNPEFKALYYRLLLWSFISHVDWIKLVQITLNIKNRRST